MKKRFHIARHVLVLVAVLVALLASPALAQETEGEGLIPSGLQSVINEAPMTSEEMEGMGLGDALQMLWNAFAQKITHPLRLFLRICLLLLLTAVATAPAKGEGGFGPLLELVCLLGCCALCVQPLQQLLQSAQEQIFYCKNYVFQMMPLFASLLAGSGQPASAAVFSGFFLSSTLLLSALVADFLLPLLQILMALHAAAGACASPAVQAAAGMSHKAVKWVLGLCSAVYGALLSVQGVLASASDSLALKTGKFLVSSSVPIVGQAVSSAMGALTAGVKVARGTAGFALLAMVAASFIPVLLQCVAFYLAFAAAGVVAQSLDCPRCGKLLQGLAQCASLCALVLLFYGLMIVLATLWMMMTGG